MQTVMEFLSWLEIGIFALLVVLSVWSIGIMIDRRRLLKSYFTPAQVDEAEKMILAGQKSEMAAWAKNKNDLTHSLVECLSSNPKQSPDSIEPEYKNWSYKQRQRLEKNLNILATLGANAPFIGLLGTVFGIIQAFSKLSNQQSGSDAVMASIAQALIATAMGLFVAIPAVIAYNYFNQRLKVMLGSSESLKNLYLSRLHLFQQQK